MWLNTALLVSDAPHSLSSASWVIIVNSWDLIPLGHDSRGLVEDNGGPEPYCPLSGKQ